MPGMLRAVRECFDRVPDPIDARDFSLSDCLMSGLAVFSLKIPSLLQFDTQVRGGEDPVKARNLRSLFGVEKVPSDTRMRERLDEVDPRGLRRCFKSIHAALQRGKVLEGWTVFGGHLLISVDGTGHHSSHKVSCKRCCVKNHRDGSKTYYHQALGAAIVHPDHAEVFPLAPEPIRNEDGTQKNDCERNASKRLIEDLRREHPHMKAVIVEDGLASNGPHIMLLKEKDLRFILGAKPGDHELLFSWFETSDTKQAWERRDGKTGIVHRFEWDHDLPLNDANFGLRVNMLKCEETDTKGQTKTFSWVTDLPLDRDTVMSVMRCGRRRWAIENETFQTLKARDAYRFEHNFGHGKNHLSDVFATLAMLAFLIDQVQRHCCPLFGRAHKHQKRILYLWNRMRELVGTFVFPDWKTLYRALAGELGKEDYVGLIRAGP